MSQILWEKSLKNLYVGNLLNRGFGRGKSQILFEKNWNSCPRELPNSHRISILWSVTGSPLSDFFPNYGGLNSLFSLFLVISKHFGENFHGFEKNSCSNNLASLQEIVEEGISKEEPVFITLPND